MTLAVPDAPAVAPEEVRRQLEWILGSKSFHNKDKLSRFLRYVVEETLAGESTRIKQYSVGEALGYEATADFDSTVRAHAHRLRQALAAYYAEDGIDAPVRIDLPKGGYVPVFSRRAPVAPAPSSKPPAASGATRFRIGAALTLAAMALAGGLVSWGWRQPATPVQPRLTQLTVPDGNYHSPSASADGRLIVYSSDLAGNSDIYLQSFATHKAVRLTTNPADDYDPDISRDGKRVVFRSMRDGGGIYLISAAGGTETRFADGFSPRFSPDGARVAYLAIEHSGEAAVFVRPSEGGQAKRVSGNLSHAQGYPVWSPDGKRLLVRAAAEHSEGQDGWWILTPDSTAPPVRTGALDAIPKQDKAFAQGLYPADWDGNRLLGAAGPMVEFTLGAGGRVSGPPRVLYPGPGAIHARYFRAAGARGILFSVQHKFVHIVGMGVDPRSGAANGVREQWTDDQTMDWREGEPISSLSADGRRLAYSSGREGKWDIWVKDIALQKEKPVTSGPEEKTRPVLNQEGARVAFLSTGKGSSAIRVAQIETGRVRTICENCGQLRHWSPDERRILAVQGHRLLEIDAGIGTRRVVLEGDAYEPQEAAYSPDGQWIALVVGIAGEPNEQGVILPAAGAARSDWIPVTEEPYNLKLHWSADGNSVYFFSRRDDFRCLWTRRLHPKSKRPLGDPVPVAHFHSSRQKILNFGWAAVSKSWLAINVTDISSRLFLLEH
jgi:Tol biopolymer transport system component